MAIYLKRIQNMHNFPLVKRPLVVFKKGKTLCVRVCVIKKKEAIERAEDAEEQ